MRPRAVLTTLAACVTKDIDKRLKFMVGPQFDRLLGIRIEALASYCIRHREAEISCELLLVIPNQLTCESEETTLVDVQLEAVIRQIDVDSF